MIYIAIISWFIFGAISAWIAYEDGGEIELIDVLNIIFLILLGCVSLISVLFTHNTLCRYDDHENRK